MIWGYGGVWSGDYEIWRLKDQELGRLQFVVDHGFKSAHFPLQQMREPERRDQIAAFVEAHDLCLTVSPHVDYFGEDRREIEEQVDSFLTDLQTYGPLLRVPIVTMAAGAVHRFMQTPSLAEQFERLREALTPLAQGCHEYGAPLGIENHGDYYCSDLVDLCQQVPHLGIFLDTGNAFLIGEKPVAAAREAAPYMIGTHFKDHVVHPDPGQLHFVIGGAALGEGHVGLAEIHGILLENAPDPEHLIMHWELVPPKDENALGVVERSWEFIRSLPTIAMQGV